MPTLLWGTVVRWEVDSDCEPPVVNYVDSETVTVSMLLTGRTGVTSPQLLANTSSTAMRIQRNCFRRRVMVCCK
jgi:hypothetical protein